MIMLKYTINIKNIQYVKQKVRFDKKYKKYIFSFQFQNNYKGCCIGVYRGKLEYAN